MSHLPLLLLSTIFIVSLAKRICGIVHAFLLLLSHYHTTLFSPSARPSPHTRYTRFWSLSSPLYARVSLLLRTIQYTELLCEMCAKRHSEKVRWRLVVALELVKAICRFIMLRVTGGRMGVSPPVAEREGILPPEGGGNEGDGDAGGNEEDEGRGKEWQMPRTGMRLPALPPASRASISNFLSHRVISADEIKSAHRLMRRLTSLQGQIAEAMWIVRPVLYALAMQRLRGNKRDWRPWVLGLAMEFAARGLGKQDLREKAVGGWRGVTGLEQEEWGKRGWGLAWWGMRGAFYDQVTR